MLSRRLPVCMFTGLSVLRYVTAREDAEAEARARLAFRLIASARTETQEESRGGRSLSVSKGPCGVLSVGGDHSVDVYKPSIYN